MTGVKFFDILTANEYDLTKAVAEIGPVSVAISASLPSFQFYSTGIYYDALCYRNMFDLDHAMTVVGFGSNGKGKDYYILKNSWGKMWGDQGYMYLARNRLNHCGVATAASYPIIS
jgi:cathepsin L